MYKLFVDSSVSRRVDLSSPPKNFLTIVFIYNIMFLFKGQQSEAGLTRLLSRIIPF